jgi:hypothetical protein
MMKDPMESLLRAYIMLGGDVDNLMHDIQNPEEMQAMSAEEVVFFKQYEQAFN